MRWVSGYWNDVEGGWQRVKGFWVSDAVDNVTYYQQPPASIEVGPSSPAPANNYFWIPGCWSYANTGFVWQGGYWAPYQPNWVWTPARWVWTPAGFVFLPGHWDYRLANRGQIFAPVYFRSTVYSNPGWFYRPTVVIPTNNLFIYLWVRPSYGCYYYGNYFGPQYVNRGFVAWANLPSYGHRHYYDPFYSYAHVHYRQQGVDFVGRVQGWHKYYDEHPDHRPPRSWHEQEQWLASHRSGGATANTQLVAHHIADTNRQGDSAVRVKRIDAQTLEAQTQHAKKLRDFDATRRTVEREHALVSTTRTPPPGDQTRSREQGKTSSLVDRAEKGDRTEKGDRADKGEKGRSRGQAVVASSTAAKLTLPKSDGPRSLSTTTRTPEGQQRGSADRGTKAPPLPTAARSSVATEDRTPNTPRPNPLEGAGRSSERAAGGQNATGQKAVDASRLPGRLDEPKITTGEPGRSITGELGNKAGPAKVRSDAGTVPGDTSRRSSDGPPRGEQKPRPNNLPQILPPGRSSELPGVTPPSSANDVPRVQPPRPSADLPRVQSSGKSGDSPAIVVPGRNESPRNSGQGNQGKVNPAKTSSTPGP
ncbi:MAG TPA: hypothetical protein VKH44_02995, partial [Pirellulaceae bacterium]|nr:hypothetical protein [Pirellulaceae bacterium]